MESETELSFDLSATKKVRVIKFKGRLLVDIREFYEKDGEELPGRKGIALTVEQYRELAKHAAEIEAVLAPKNCKVKVANEPRVIHEKVEANELKELNEQEDANKRMKVKEEL